MKNYNNFILEKVKSSIKKKSFRNNFSDEKFRKIKNKLPDDIDIYKEIEIIKSKNRNQSILYNIIKNVDDISDNTIIGVAMKFLNLFFPDIVEKYKKDNKRNKKKFKEPITKIEIPIKDSNSETLTTPSRIGHNYIPIEVLPISDLELYKNHKRLQTFYYKGLKCSNPNCDKEGYYLIKTLDLFNNEHIDIYTKNFDLMTVDHIIPKSKGGTYDLENLDPMMKIIMIFKNKKMSSFLIKKLDILKNLTIYFFKIILSFILSSVSTDFVKSLKLKYLL